MRIYINRFIQVMVLLTMAFVCHRNLDAAPFQILINHPGYDTHGHKSLVVQSAEEMEPARFEVTDSEGRAAFEGLLHKSGAVAGWKGRSYLQGDFTTLNQPGQYRIQVKGERSERFTIGGRVMPIRSDLLFPHPAVFGNL